MSPTAGQFNHANRDNPDILALLNAAAAGDLGQITRLLDRGVNVNAITRIERTALHAAASNGQADAVRLLIRRDARTDISSNKDNWPLHDALAGQHPDCVDALLEAGAKMEQPDNPRFTPAIITGVLSGNPDCLDVLKKRGADLNARSYDGRAALHFIAEFRLGTEENLDWLIENGADLNIRTGAMDTPLMRAIGAKSNDVVDALLEAGVDITVRNRENSTPYLLAIQFENYSAAEKIFDLGGDTGFPKDELKSMSPETLSRIRQSAEAVARFLEISRKSHNPQSILDAWRTLPTEEMREQLSLTPWLGNAHARTVKRRPRGARP